MMTRRWRRRRGLFVFVIIAILENLRTSRRRRFAGAETSLRFSQVALNTFSDRVRTAKHAPRDGFYLLERSNGLALIVERGVGVIVVRARNVVIISPFRGSVSHLVKVDIFASPPPWLYLSEGPYGRIPRL